MSKSRRPSKKKIGGFRVKVSPTSDEKVVKDGTQTYTYGTVSVRSLKLKPFIGKTVFIEVYLLDGDLIQASARRRGKQAGR